MGSIFLVLCIASCAQENPAQTPERIILISVDTLRRDHVSAYSQTGAAKAHTPNIDRIANEGQVFTNAVSSFHATTMSVASLFTGLTPSIESGQGLESIKWNTFVACGMSRFLEEGQDDACLPTTVMTLAEDMKSAGYWTVGVVSNELLYRPNGYDRGFDSWVEVGLAKADEDRNIFESSPVRTATHVNRDVERALADRPSDKFFLYVHYLDVHDYSLFKRTYATAVERFDKQLGELFEQLDTAGLLESATVIITSDHGELLDETYANLKTVRHFGNPALQPTLEIPLIIKPATHLAPNRFIRSQDVRGLLLELVGLDEPPASELEPDELFLSEMFYQTYRKGRWKSHWPRTGEPALLFDLHSDPGEKINLAVGRSDEHAGILEAHRSRLDELSRNLATRSSQVPVMDDEDVLRLRALGYIETTDEAFGKQSSPRDQGGTKSD